MSRNIGLVAALALMPVIGVVILPLCAVAVGMSAACCGDCCGFKHLLADGAFLMLCAVGGFGSCRVNDPLAGAVSRNIGLIAALALVPVVGAVILPLCTVAVGMSAACCGDLQLELDRAVGIIILYQLCVLAVYLQLHIVGKGHARLGLQINVGRIFLTDLKRVTILHAEPEHQGRFELIRIAAGHGEVHGAVGMLAGHRRCYLHRRLRHIVRVCGGVFGEVHNDNRECIISANLFDDSIGNGNIFLSKIFCNGNSVFKVEVEQCGVALSGVVCVVVIQSSRRKRITLTENLGAQLHHIRSGGIGRSQVTDLAAAAIGLKVQIDLLDGLCLRGRASHREVHIDNYVVVVDDVDTINRAVGNGDVLLRKAICKGIATLGIQRIPHVVVGVCIIASCVECPIFIDIRRRYAHALGGAGRGCKIDQSVALVIGLDGQIDGIDLGCRVTADREGHTDDHVVLVDAPDLPHLAVGQGDAAGIKAICKDSVRFSDELEGYAVGLVRVIGRPNVCQFIGICIRICPVVVADVIQL